jgi:ATP/maltotriose-dependent transcriptional regulator MalT/DNA-binding SARP family transcriptional activator
MNLAKFLPPCPARIFERERLLNKLASWEDRKLIVIHAQAGQGKSTLAAGYVQTLGSPSAWYNLDQQDENPTLFLSLLGQVIRNTWPRQVPKLPPMPRDRYSREEIHEGTRRWVEEVLSLVPKHGLIVFDEYHSSSLSSPLQRLIRLVIESGPPLARFMVLSRRRPALDIAKLRSTQSLGELSGEDLRFTDAEVQDLFAIIFHMQISKTEAALINGTAEGWPAGLVLMHEYLVALPPDRRVSVLRHQQPPAFRSHIFDYLAQEVFQHLPREMQQFLLRTSISDYLPRGLIQILTGMPFSGASQSPVLSTLIAELQSRNLFVTTAGEDASIIRYHALFREFLQNRLASDVGQAEVMRLYSRASLYFQKAGDPVRSIDLLLASRQFEKAVRQIEACGEYLVAQGQVRTLMRWIEALPAAFRNRPWFLFYCAVSCRFTAPHRALTFFSRALQGFRSTMTAAKKSSGLVYSLCGLIEACFHTGGDFNRMGRLATMAQTILDRRRQPPEERARLLLATGMAWFFIGRLERGTNALRLALDLFRKQKDHFYQITSAIYLTPCALYCGDFALARESLKIGFEAFASIPDETGGQAALLLTKAMTALFEGKLTEAQECIDRCKDLADTHALQAIGFLSLDIAGWLKIAQGDYGGAEVMLAECKRQGEEARNAFFSASAAHLLAIACMFQGKLDEAKLASDYALAIRTQSGSKLFYAVYLIVSGVIHFKLGSCRRAEQELQTAVKTLRQIRAEQQEANAHLALAMLYSHESKKEKACKHLKEGFSIGRNRGFTYYALFTREELMELATYAKNHGICTHYCDQLIALKQAQAFGRLRVHCLGGFRVKRDQALVRDGEWKSKLAKALVKILAAQDNQSMPREQAMEWLWPDTKPANLRTTFNSLIHRARKVLERGSGAGKDIFCIQQEGGVVSLNPTRVWTDVGQFLFHLHAAERLKTAHDREKVLTEYEKALALYEGDFLPEDRYSDWAISVRDQLRVRYLSALEHAAALAEASGNRSAALKFHERLFMADPCNEKSCCWLMMRYQSEGRRNDAIRSYERCELALRRNLELEPEKRTKQIYRSIIGG